MRRSYVAEFEEQTKWHPSHEWDGVKRFTEDFLTGLAAPSGAAQP
jgi:hypothetical protein